MDALARAWTTSAWAELSHEVPLNVSGGPLPAWLDGQYFLATASGFEVGSRNLTHLFDGFSKLVRWRFAGDAGPPTVRARLLQSEWLDRSRKKDDIVPTSTVGGVLPPFSALARASSPWTGCTDNFNVAFHDFGAGASAVVLSDVGDPGAAGARIDADTLQSSSFKWRDSWAVPISDRISPAHPRTVPDGSGDTVGLITRLNPLAASGLMEHSLILYRTNASSADPLARRVLHTVKVKQLPYVHSIGITPTHAVICAGPLHWDVGKLLLGTPASKAWAWDEDTPTTIYKLPLDPSAAIDTYEAAPFFSFHHVNAWHEPNGTLSFDLVVNPNLTAARANPAAAFELGSFREPSERDAVRLYTELRRYALPEGAVSARPATGLSGAGSPPVSYRTLPLVDGKGRISTGAELPTFNSAYIGRSYCYAYLWAPQYGGDPRWSQMALLKKNVCDERAPVLAWRKDGHFPGEATFAPSRPTAPSHSRPSPAVREGSGAAPEVEEDDGVLMAAVQDTLSDETYLLVLNASSMETLAELRMPSEMPEGVRQAGDRRLLAFGIHGRYSAD